MWERFSYYGMRAIFVLFMTKALMFDKAHAADIYGTYTGLVYLTPLIGGYIADRYWGNRRSILVGGVLMAIGQFMLFFSGSLHDSNVQSAAWLLYGGLGMLIAGNGLFAEHFLDGGPALPRWRQARRFRLHHLLHGHQRRLADRAAGLRHPRRHRPSGRLQMGLHGRRLRHAAEPGHLLLFKNKYLVTPEGKPIGMAPKRHHDSGEKWCTRR